ncbi:MAG: hypothetical protein WDO69_04670 [Pseudomonadota bacterium]
MAFRNLAVPWLGGGLVLGYAAFSWLRAKRADRERARPRASLPDEVHEPVELLSSHLEHVPDEVALNLEPEPLPANNNALPRSAALGALFLGRASEALSPFPFGPRWPSAPR